MLIAISKERLLQLAGATQKAFKTPLKQHLFDFAIRCLPERQLDSAPFMFERVVGLQSTVITPPVTQCPQIEIRNAGYDYQNENWYVIFANRELGGGYLNRGFVQEEILTIECPEIAIALSQFNLLGPLDRREVGVYSNVDRGCQILLYGHQDVNEFESKNRKRINLSEAVQKVPPKKINCVAIDAINVSKKRNGASKEDLQYMFDKATAGFETIIKHGAKEVHTGKWGCGAYGNDLTSIFLLTILAAWKAGLQKVVFYLYDGSGLDVINPIVKDFATLSYPQMEQRLFAS